MQEAEVEGGEDEDGAGVHEEPCPEMISEEQHVHADDDRDHDRDKEHGERCFCHIKIICRFGGGASWRRGRVIKIRPRVYTQTCRLSNMKKEEHKQEREKDVSKVISSEHLRKIIVAGPGTGKSYLFTELIKQKQKEGKSDFVAITFIGKLGDALADDLCGLAETLTMHGFARKLVLGHCGPDWVYYPKIYDIIKEDLEAAGIKKFEIGDESYRERTLAYKAVGDADVVHYAVETCKKDERKIPVHDLILVDEYQDFNETESELVDILAQKMKSLL